MSRILLAAMLLLAFGCSGASSTTVQERSMSSASLAQDSDAPQMVILYAADIGDHHIEYGQNAVTSVAWVSESYFPSCNNQPPGTPTGSPCSNSPEVIRSLIDNHQGAFNGLAEIFANMFPKLAIPQSLQDADAKYVAARDVAITNLKRANFDPHQRPGFGPVAYHPASNSPEGVWWLDQVCADAIVRHMGSCYVGWSSVAFDLPISADYEEKWLVGGHLSALATINGTFRWGHYECVIGACPGKWMEDYSRPIIPNEFKAKYVFPMPPYFKSAIDVFDACNGSGPCEPSAGAMADGLLFEKQ